MDKSCTVRNPVLSWQKHHRLTQEDEAESLCRAGWEAALLSRELGPEAHSFCHCPAVVCY